MSVMKLFDDPEFRTLITRVEEGHGADEVSRAFERAYAAVVRQQRTQMKPGEAFDSLPILRERFDVNSKALIRAH
jgi:hypothetical protein